ncbi:MAG TPA: hypothetical protein VFZ47_09265 [Chitinophagaceae bacterium]
MKLVHFAAIGMFLVLTACSSSRITHAWKDKDAQVAVYQKVMVMGLMKEADHGLLERLEKHFTGDLNDLGYTSVSAFQQYGPKAFEGLDEQHAINKLTNTGADAVITIVLLDKSRERYYVPDKVYYSPYGVYSGNFWGYYNTMYTRIYSPGYYQETRYFWESNLYDLKTNKLIYSVQTESFDPSSLEALAHEYGKLIVNAMVKADVLAKHKKPILH